MQMHALEQSWSTFAQRHNLVTYDARLLAYDRGQMLCVEMSTGRTDKLFDMEENAIRALRECGLELLVPQGKKGIWVRLYLVRAA